jgi:sugar phosphate isomerase/epimerase
VINITEPVKSKRIAMVDEIKRAMEIADTIPFRYLIQHIGVGGEEFDEHKSEAAFTALEELVLFGRNRGVEILLENIPNGFSSAQRLLNFLAETHLAVGLCFDTGHAHMNEGVKSAFEIMGDRIRSTHIHDNDGGSDAHLAPFSGSIDWGETMRLLRSRPGQYPLLLELRDELESPQPLVGVTRLFERLESL